ncbi:VOC family protein [Spirosoma daeguense]
MIDFKRLDHVLICIPVGATSDAHAFYADVLELPEIVGQHPDGAMWFQMGDIELHIREEAGGNFSKRHPAFEIGNLESAKGALEKKGVAIEYSSLIEGRQRFFFRDPFGNRFEMLEYSE